jgi:hypothetical protein
MSRMRTYGAATMRSLISVVTVVSTELRVRLPFGSSNLANAEGAPTSPLLALCPGKRPSSRAKTQKDRTDKSISFKG